MDRKKGDGKHVDCKQIEEKLFQFFDNELDDKLVAHFRIHLEHCIPCAERHDYTRRFLALIRQRCVRRTAPSRLRIRILSSLPHRGEHH